MNIVITKALKEAVRIIIDDRLTVLVQESFIGEDEFFELGGYVFQNCSVLTDEICKSKQNKVVATIGTTKLEGIPVIEK